MNARPKVTFLASEQRCLSTSNKLFCSVAQWKGHWTCSWRSRIRSQLLACECNLAQVVHTSSVRWAWQQRFLGPPIHSHPQYLSPSAQIPSTLKVITASRFIFNSFLLVHTMMHKRHHVQILPPLYYICVCCLVVSPALNNPLSR